MVCEFILGVSRSSLIMTIFFDNSYQSYALFCTLNLRILCIPDDIKTCEQKVCKFSLPTISVFFSRQAL